MIELTKSYITRSGQPVILDDAYTGSKGDRFFVGTVMGTYTKWDNLGRSMVSDGMDLVEIETEPKTKGRRAWDEGAVLIVRDYFDTAEHIDPRVKNAVHHRKVRDDERTCWQDAPAADWPTGAPVPEPEAAPDLALLKRSLGAFLAFAASEVQSAAGASVKAAKTAATTTTSVAAKVAASPEIGKIIAALPTVIYLAGGLVKSFNDRTHADGK